MVTQSFSLTEKQVSFIQNEISEGEYGNASEFIRDLIRQEQRRRYERLERMLAIGEQSGTSKKTLKEIYQEALKEYAAENQ